MSSNKSIKEIRREYKQKLADIDLYYDKIGAKRDKDSAKKLTDIKTNGRIRQLDIQKRGKDNLAYIKHKYSNKKNADEVLEKELKRNEQVFINKANAALNNRAKNYSKIEEKNSLKMLLIDAKYNRSCRSIWDRLLSMILTVAILCIKLMLFIVDSLPGKQEISNFIYNSIFNLTNEYSWVHLLIFPALLLTIFLINIFSTLNAKLHEVISGVATVFTADTLLRVAAANTDALKASPSFDMGYISLVFGVFALVLTSFSVTLYPTVRSIFLSAKQKYNASEIMSVGKLIGSTNDPSTNDRIYYFDTGKKIVGGFYKSMAIIIVIFASAAVTAGWIYMVNIAVDNLYNYTITLLFALPSLINLIEIGSRPNANENLLKEFIAAGSEFMPKPNNLALVGAQFKNTFLPFIK